MVSYHKANKYGRGVSFSTSYLDGDAMADENAQSRVKHNNAEIMKIGLWLSKNEIGDDPEDLLKRVQEGTGICMTMYHLKRYCANLDIEFPKPNRNVQLRMETKIDLLQSDLKAAQQRINNLETRLAHLETALGT
jgi:hypothetical protein